MYVSQQLAPRPGHQTAVPAQYRKIAIQVTLVTPYATLEHIWAVKTHYWPDRMNGLN